jgi:putative DNA primase/helicase
VGLDNRIPEYEGRNLALEFKPFLPGLLKRVLEIPRDRVTALIKHTDRNVPALALRKWSQLIETNPIAAWVDECTVLDPDAKTYIGKDDPEQAGRWLYANFCKYQRESGHKSVLPVKRFSANLRDLLKNQLKTAIGEGRDRNGSYIQGIGLRCYYDPNGTRYNSPVTGEGERDGFEEECDGFVTAETRMSDGCDGCDGFFEVHQSSPKNAALEEPQDLVESNAENKVERYRENASHPSHPSPTSIPAIENPSPDPSHQEVVATAPTPSTKSELRIYQRSDGGFEVESSLHAPSSPTVDEMAGEEVDSICHDQTEFQENDQVMTPQGEGVVLYFNEYWGEYNVALARSTDYFKPEQLRLIEQS